MKKYWWLLIFIFVLIAGFIINLNLPNTESPKKQSIVLVPDNSSQQNIEPAIILNSTGIDLQTLSKHNAKSDCWIVYNSKVYDITSYISRHPGGTSTITNTCGNTDFDSTFKGYHGTSYETRLLSVAIYMGDLK
jgi:cytochrome b involved in lipid metabolism